MKLGNYRIKIGYAPHLDRKSGVGRFANLINIAIHIVGDMFLFIRKVK